MTAELAAFIASNATRRLDQAQRDLGPQEWQDSYETVIRGQSPILDEWALLQRDGYLQTEDGLRLMPVLVYPGIALDPWVITPTAPPKASTLYVRIAYKLSGNSTGGWNGAIAASASLHWGTPPPNVIFPGTYAYSMPPNDTFVWHYELGHTDNHSLYTPTTQGHNRALGQLIPPL